MAELPHLGKHCFSCQQNDFLPFICSFCKRIFCKEHAAAISHCCTKEIEENKLEIEAGKRKSDFVSCHFCANSNSILETAVCSVCHKRFCLAHRHKADHQCCPEVSSEPTPEDVERRNQIETALAKVRASLSSGLTVKNRGAKNTALALKVALMKLKSTASGQESIPVKERLYFYISFIPNDCCFAQECKKFTSKPVFLCSQWSIGKCVDWLASHFSLINKNNEPSKPKLVATNESRVRHSSREISTGWCCENKTNYLCFSHQLEDLESRNIISNADSLLLLYLQI